MANQWAIAPFTIGEKLPDDHLSPKIGESRQDHYARCRATILLNDVPVSPDGVVGEVQF